MGEEQLNTMTQLPLMARFAIALAVIVVVPHLSKRVRLPAVVGLLLAGVLFGPSGLQISPKHGEVVHFFADVGKLLLMFFAGLEIDLIQFNRSRNRAMSFGFVTFAIPLMAGIAVGVGFGYGWTAALLIGSLIASHTLLAFPIVQKLGLIRNEAITVTIGATVFTDIASLLVLAVCIPIHQSGFSPSAFTLQLVQLAVYIPLVLVGLSALARILIRRLQKSENVRSLVRETKDVQLLVMLLVVVLASIGAEMIHLEGIIGAFLAGIALNRTVHGTEVKEELEFLGNTLFVPMFFITVGFLIDIQIFIQTVVNNIGLVLAIVAGLIISKLVAAQLARLAFGYTRDESYVMWSLSLPQVAATLAAALVAYEAKNASGQRLIDDPVLNTIIVLMVVTSLLGPVLTERYAPRLAVPDGTPGASSTPQP